jgi:outer membrane protein assembly factor BamA
MARRFRILLRVVVVVIAVIAGLIVTIHLRPVQRAVWERVRPIVEDVTGLTISVGELSLRAWPARLEVGDVEVRSDSGQLATIDLVVVTWSWRQLKADPPRLDSLVLTSPTIDLRALPENDRKSSSDGAPIDPWSIVEIGRLSITSSDLDGSAPDVDWRARNVAMAGHLLDGSAAAKLELESVEVTHDGRMLRVGPIRLEATADRGGQVSVTRLDVEGDEVSLRASGSLDPAPPYAADVQLELQAGLDALVRWWDPEIAARLQPSGRLDVIGSVGWNGTSPVAELRHRGERLGVAGMVIDSLAAASSGGSQTAEISGPWGQAKARLDNSKDIIADLDLTRADPRPLLDTFGIRDSRIPSGPVELSGTVHLATSLPVDVRGVTGRVDLRARADELKLDVAGSGADGVFVADRLRLEMAQATVVGAGRVDLDGKVAGSVRLDVADPARTLTAVAAWLPADLEGLEIGGGPLRADARIDGSVADPHGVLDLSWERPSGRGITVASVVFHAEGTRTEIAWRGTVAPVAEATLEASGTTSVGDFATEVTWGVDLPDLAAATGLLPPDLTIPVEVGGGPLVASGTASWKREGWNVAGTMEATAVIVDSWTIDRLKTDISADPQRATLSSLRLEVLGGVVEGDLSSPVAITSGADVSADLRWSGFQVARLVSDPPPWLGGSLEGHVSVDGPSTAPVVEGSVDFLPATQDGPIRSAGLDVAIGEGVLRAIGRDVVTAAGGLEIRASVPLGSLQRPDWLWTDAPDGPVRFQVEGLGLRSKPLMQALGITATTGEVRGDLVIDGRWDLQRAEARYAEVRLEHVIVDNDVEVLRSDGPIVLEVDGEQAVIRSARLDGDRSHVDVHGSYRFTAGEIDGQATVRLSPDMVRLLPFPMRATGGIDLDVDVAGPVDKLTGRLELNHRGGSLVMRDPPVEIRDLHLSAVLEDGAWFIEDGGAQFNRGQVTLGGGWDPASGQGLVVEMQDVILVLPMSILTRWSGDLSIEPDSDPDRLAKVVGDLTLDSGLWDRPVDLAGAIFGPAALDPAGDDPLYAIGLDLRVRGRGGVHVENNLGTFDVGWDTLSVTGSAAVPEIRGEVRIDPGGSLALPGRTVTVQRGTFQFTGHPETDPVIEIVPLNDVANYSSGSSDSQIDTTQIATSTLARGLGSALGFENETLQPAEISVATETATGSRLSFGQRIGRNLALFLSTDLADAQDRKTMVQLWNLRAFPGLAIQAYDDAGQESQGLAAIQRFHWGGTGASDTRSIIQRLKLEGEWPLSTRRLKSATGLRKGQPYDDFMVFVAGVRMERELAGAGFQLARVDGEIEGPGNLPTLVFRCDPGPRQIVLFEGERPPQAVRQEVTAAYQPPPLEGLALRSMKDILVRHFQATGHAAVAVTVERRDAAIVATTALGPKVEFKGPFIDGLDESAAQAIQRVLGTPSELASALEDPDRTTRIIRRVLYGRGYQNPEVRRVWGDRGKDGSVRVHIEIEPGPVETVQAIELKGTDPLGALDHEDLGLAVGMPIDRGRIDVAVSDIRSAYVESGYRQADVRTQFDQLEEPHSWRLVIRLEPGVKRTIRNIVVEGMERIKERYLRHGLTVKEGEVLVPTDLDRSVVRTATFAPVKRLAVETTPVGADQVDITFGVTEKPRYTVEFGGGWDSDRGPQYRLGLRDDNLFGRGFSLNLRGLADADQNVVLLYAALPPLPGSRLTFSSTISYYDGDLRSDPSNYSEARLAVSLEGTYRVSLSDSLRAYLTRSRSERTFLNYADFPFLPPGIFDVVANETILGLQAVRDRLDNPFDPHRGYSLALDTSSNMPELGSDLADIRALLRGSVAVDPWNRVTWLQAGRLGWAAGRNGQEVIDMRRYFAGGQGSIRGFERDAVGPVDVAETGVVPAGGNALFVLNEELRFPLWGPVRLAVFADAGQVWTSWSDADFRLAVGAGLGVRISTPIGPLWGDIAWPVANRGDIATPKAKFYLGIGRPF